MKASPETRAVAPLSSAGATEALTDGRVVRNPSPVLAALAVVLLTGCGGGTGTSSHAPSSGAPASRATAAEAVMKNGLPLRHRKGPVPGYLTIHVVLGRVAGLGTVLVDGSGRTFYAFQPDRRRAVTCTGTCASVWHPFELAPAQALDSSPALEAALLGGVPDPEGGRVVTFAGWPLYTYAGDTRAGTANGQGLYSHGGRWYAISKSGALVGQRR